MAAEITHWQRTSVPRGEPLSRALGPEDAVWSGPGGRRSLPRVCRCPMGLSWYWAWWSASRDEGCRQEGLGPSRWGHPMSYLTQVSQSRSGGDAFADSGGTVPQRSAREAGHHCELRGVLCTEWSEVINMSPPEAESPAEDQESQSVSERNSL